VAEGGRIAHIAGQVAVDSEGRTVGEGDVDAQIERCFGNIGLVLESLGAGWPNVAKMTTYLTSADSIADFYRVRARLFEGFFPDGGYPPNTLLVVSRLVRPELLVEIEAVAVF
jgi:2-iminobutanoate/2-iminopropanoate deaminase